MPTGTSCLRRRLPNFGAGLAGKKKGQKKKNSRTQTVTISHNLDLNRLNLQKALGFLAEFHKTEVQECIQKTSRPPYWQITEPILEHIDLLTPSHRLLAPHMDDMFQALELMTGSGGLLLPDD